MVESREKIFQVLTNEFSELSKEEADQMLDDFAVDVIKVLSAVYAVKTVLKEVEEQQWQV